MQKFLQKAYSMCVRCVCGCFVFILFIRRASYRHFSSVCVLCIRCTATKSLGVSISTGFMGSAKPHKHATWEKKTHHVAPIATCQRRDQTPLTINIEWDIFPRKTPPGWIGIWFGYEVIILEETLRTIIGWWLSATFADCIVAQCRRNDFALNRAATHITPHHTCNRMIAIMRLLNDWLTSTYILIHTNIYTHNNIYDGKTSHYYSSIWLSAGCNERYVRIDGNEMIRFAVFGGAGRARLCDHAENEHCHFHKHRISSVRVCVCVVCSSCPRTHVYTNIHTYMHVCVHYITYPWYPSIASQQIETRDIYVWVCSYKVRHLLSARPYTTRTYTNTHKHRRAEIDKWSRALNSKQIFSQSVALHQCDINDRSGDDDGVGVGSHADGRVACVGKCVRVYYVCSVMVAETILHEYTRREHVLF